MENNQNKNSVLIQDLGMKFATQTSKRKFRYGLYKCFCGGKKWRASISINKKSIKLGAYITALEAAKAYDNYIIANGLEHTRNFN